VSTEPIGRDDEGQVRPFAAVLQEHRQGGLHSELSEKLAEVVAGVMEHGKAGSVSVTLNIKQAEMPGAIVVTDDVKAKVPQADKPAALFYADERGNLSRRDPRQPELPLRKVDGGRDNDEPNEEVASS
jgi:hypothetical protein